MNSDTSQLPALAALIEQHQLVQGKPYAACGCELYRTIRYLFPPILAPKTRLVKPCSTKKRCRSAGFTFSIWWLLCRINFHSYSIRSTHFRMFNTYLLSETKIIDWAVYLTIALKHL